MGLIDQNLLLPYEYKLEGSPGWGINGGNQHIFWPMVPLAISLRQLINYWSTHFSVQSTIPNGQPGLFQQVDFEVRKTIQTVGAISFIQKFCFWNLFSLQRKYLVRIRGSCLEDIVWFTHIIGTYPSVGLRSVKANPLRYSVNLLHSSMSPCRFSVG